MSYIYEQKKGSDGKVHCELVVDNTADMNDPTQQRDKLIKQVMQTELQDIINTCKEIGSTNGSNNNGSSGGSSDVGSTDPTDSPAVEAAKKAVQAAQNAVDQAKSKVASDQTAGDVANRKYQQDLQSLQDAQKNLSNLKSKLSSAEQTLNDLKNELSHCPRNIGHWEGRMHYEKPNPEYDKLKNQISAQENLINQLSGQISTQTAQVNSLNSTVSADKTICDSLSKQIAADQSELSKDQTALTNAVNHLHSLDPTPGKNGKQNIHDLIWKHNVFWALLHIAMEGDSSIFNILTSALGKIANAMNCNQQVTQVITDINNDLKELVNFPASNPPPSPEERQKEVALMQDLQKQLLKLYYIINPDAPATTQTEKDMKKAVGNIGKELSPELQNEAKQLFNDYKGSFNSATGGSDPDDPTGLQRMLDQMNGKNLPKGMKQYQSFDTFLDGMVNRSASGAPSASTNAIYSHTSSFITSLNTAGSEFMAQQNLETKQIDQIEKLWTSGISTDKSLIQTVAGNIAN